MGHLDSAWQQSKPGRLRRPGLLLIVVLVLLAHLVVAWLVKGLLANWSFPAPTEQMLFAQLVQPPSPPLPSPAPAVPSVPKASPSLPPVAAPPPPGPTAAVSTELKPQASSPQDPYLGALEKTEALRLSRPADLMPNQGVLPLRAYWGRYDQGGQLLGEGEIVMHYPTPAQYQVALRARALGWLSLLVSGEVGIKSEGILTSAGLSPMHFEQVTPRRGRVESRFDPVARLAVLRPTQDPMPIPVGTQDRLSVVFQLAWLGESQPGGLRPGQRFDLPLATLSEVRMLTFHASDREDLAFPGGMVVPTIKVVSDPFQFRRVGQIQIWLDQADRHMPARILYTEPDGRALDFLAIRAPQ